MAEWVVLELSPKAEGEDPDLIRTSIRHQIRDAEVYIPVSVTRVGDDKLVTYLVDGYAFIKRNHPDEKYFRLEGSRYVQTVISTIGRNGGRPVRTLSCATDADIERFKGQVHAEENQGIGVGDLIVVTSGPYRQIQATVIEDIPEREEVSVHIKLRSKEDIVTLPRSFLRLVQRAQKSPYLERVEGFRAWFDGIKPFLTSDSSRFATLVDSHEAFQRYDLWQARWRPLNSYFQSLQAKHDFQSVLQRHAGFDMYDRSTRLLSFILAVSRPSLDLDPLRKQGATLSRLVGWDSKWKSIVPSFQKLQSILPQGYSPGSFESLQAKYQTWRTAENVSERLGAIKNELEEIERSMTEPHGNVDVVIIDGHNLAVRCAVVPGLDQLKDSQGRYTGAIVGFLRSLGSFRKRFPTAEIIVTWDGSSQRRKALFSAYKANRQVGVFQNLFGRSVGSATNGHTNGSAATAITPNGELEVNGSAFVSDEVKITLNGESNGSANVESNGTRPFNQIHWLRDVLPLLGVKQAWNPEEEADDVIATLVAKYPGKKCVLISTDRDLLQLVSDDVQVFIPGKDRFMDSAAVEADYGVKPDHIVDLRAIDGDTSDNIPGVRGFGLKTAAKLLRLYGTVEGVYASNFSAVTTAQYKKLRESEQQVRLNLQLMSLHHDVPFTVVEPNPDQIVASQRLKDVEVKSEAIIAAMLHGG